MRKKADQSAGLRKGSEIFSPAAIKTEPSPLYELALRELAALEALKGLERSVRHLMEAASNFWLPWFRSGNFVKSKAPPPSGARWHLLTIFQIKWLAILLSIFGIIYCFGPASVASVGRLWQHYDGLTSPPSPKTLQKIAYTELSKRISNFLEPFALIADKAALDRATNEYVFSTPEFIQALDKFKMVDRPDEYLTTKGTTWAGWIASQAHALDQGLNQFIVEYRDSLDVETLNRISTGICVATL